MKETFKEKQGFRSTEFQFYHVIFLFFFIVEEGEQAFVLVIKHLIDFDGNKLSRLSGGYVKMNIKDRTTVCDCKYYI